MDADLIVENLCKSFASLNVIDKWNLRIGKSERIVLLGPSGAGKTTFLRILAGLEKPGSGKIEVSSKKISFVFQEPRLIPWCTVKDNLLFVNDNGDINAVLKKLRLQDFEDYFPAQLSGGMQQRVNLARALLMEPELLILDEAFASLDLPVKKTIMEDMLAQWRAQHFTLIAVTHDLKEALFIADRILIISHQPSRILQEVTVNLGENRSFSSKELLSLESELLNIVFKSDVHEHQGSKV